MPTHDVYGIGNALVDIQVQVDDALLHRILHDPHPARPLHSGKGSMHLVDTGFQGHLLQLLEDHDHHTASGGSGCNTMFGLAQMGVRVKYAGKVGDDVYGAFYTEDLHQAGVDFDVPFGADATGTCLVLVTPDAQRTMFTHLGISVALTPNDLDLDTIARSRWVYIEGYLWDAPGPRAASIKAMETAKRHGARIAYSYSDPFCVARARDDFDAFTREFVDLVFCNEAEALAFAQTDSAESALAHLRTLHTNVALTRSAQGSVIVFDGATYTIPPVVVDPVDTTGAGDLYAAGVLAGLCQGQTIQEAGLLGSRLAAQVITVRGARLPQQAVALKTGNGIS